MSNQSGFPNELVLAITNCFELAVPFKCAKNEQKMYIKFYKFNYYNKPFANSGSNQLGLSYPITCSKTAPASFNFG
jgi:hypothetical protein